MKKTLIIAWLYPDLMSTYGDRGNIIVLQKRCQWRGIEVKIEPITIETSVNKLKHIDLIFGGGAQDAEQAIVIKDLLGQKGKTVKSLIEKNVPALFVCGAPQLMGNYYEPAAGKRLEGLGIFDMESKHPGPMDDRLIGNIVAKISNPEVLSGTKIVGFENHGGRTYLGESAKPFAKVLKGNGNNGKDGTEGCVYKNAIGCYFHGPLLPKNPEIADWFIATALKVKYGKSVELKKLNDELEQKAKEVVFQKLDIKSGI